ncbi:MAG: ComF family protein [Gemmataceae bacterium]|nr:ComF family protein [Gemmataceae bacterium]
MSRSRLAEVARGFLHLLYPNACLICDAPEAGTETYRHGLCSGCLAAVTADLHDACPRCAATVGPHTDTADGCPACRGRGFAFARAVRLGPYDGQLRDAVLRMKHAPGEGLAEMMGRVFSATRGPALKDAGAGLVLPVPLHWRRRWARGYNQAAALGRELAAALGAEFRPGWLRRVKAATQKSQPSATARRENMKGAFRVGRGARCAGRAVLLVDDVMTTGATADEAARVVRQAGAAAVTVAVLARA